MILKFKRWTRMHFRPLVTKARTLPRMTNRVALRESYWDLNVYLDHEIKEKQKELDKLKEEKAEARRSYRKAMKSITPCPTSE